MLRVRTRHRRVRVLETLRSAHLERAAQTGPALLVYGSRRYDFDPSLAAGLDVVRAGLLRTATIVATGDVRELEINEPLMLSGLPRTAVAVATVRLVGRLRRRRVLVVTYAIENDDPFRPVVSGPRALLRRQVQRVLMRYVARRVDRIAFGTQAARDMYGRMLPGRLRRAESVLIPALPAPLVEPDVDKDPDRVLFLGAFDERKGLRRVLDAWPAVARSRPSARLVVVGTGPLEDLARAHAAADPTVDLLVAPARNVIGHQLARSSVVVLLSQERPRWREQVGLPIVEGLAHGCSVVTTSQTGIAAWLTDHGHTVLEADAPAHEVATALAAALDRRRPAASVLADLPSRDGRLAADRWLFTPTAAGDAHPLA